MGNIHESGLLEEGFGVFAIGDRPTGLARGGVEVVPELAEGGGFVGWAVRVVAARSPVDFDEFAEPAGCYVPVECKVSSRNLCLFCLFLEEMD